MAYLDPTCIKLCSQRIRCDDGANDGLDDFEDLRLSLSTSPHSSTTRQWELGNDTTLIYSGDISGSDIFTCTRKQQQCDEPWCKAVNGVPRYSE